MTNKMQLIRKIEVFKWDMELVFTGCRYNAQQGILYVHTVYEEDADNDDGECFEKQYTVSKNTTGTIMIEDVESPESHYITKDDVDYDLANQLFEMLCRES